MPSELPYMMQVGNVSAILSRMQEAGTPPRFTHEFLKNSLGFRGSGDRGIIKVLKQLGFLTSDGTPTERYNRFRSDEGGLALAEGLREGWAEVFLADQQAHTRSASQLTQILKGITGAGDASARKMATTFKALAAQANWTDPMPERGADADSEGPSDGPSTDPVIADGAGPRVLRLHHDIHLHLPATSDVAVYAAVFRAIRDELSD